MNISATSIQEGVEIVFPFSVRKIFMKVTIKPGCISCGTCEFTAPEIFEVETVSQVKKDADLAAHREKIKQAVMRCPVQVIEFDEQAT